MPFRMQQRPRSSEDQQQREPARSSPVCGSARRPRTSALAGTRTARPGPLGGAEHRVTRPPARREDGHPLGPGEAQPSPQLRSPRRDGHSPARPHMSLPAARPCTAPLNVTASQRSAPAPRLEAGGGTLRPARGRPTRPSGPAALPAARRRPPAAPPASSGPPKAGPALPHFAPPFPCDWPPPRPRPFQYGGAQQRGELRGLRRVPGSGAEGSALPGGVRGCGRLWRCATARPRCPGRPGPPRLLVPPCRPRALR